MQLCTRQLQQLQNIYVNNSVFLYIVGSPGKLQPMDA